jgi:hypothetical protein
MDEVTDVQWSPTDERVYCEQTPGFVGRHITDLHRVLWSKLAKVRLDDIGILSVREECLVGGGTPVLLSVPREFGTQSGAR